MESKTDQYIESLISEVSELNDKNKQLLEEIEGLKSKLILSEQKVKLNYNCIIELQNELKDCTENYNHYVDKCFKLESNYQKIDSDYKELLKRYHNTRTSN